jgi:hypothetical protein
MIVGNGGRLIFKDVLALEDGLCHRLADTPRTNAGVLGFVDEFGLLTHGVSELLEDFYANIAVAKRLVKMKKTHHYDGYVEWMAVHRTKIRLHPELQYPPTGGPPQLFFGPGTLFDAIWLQFFQEVSNSTQLRPCKRPGCLTWVAYGPGTGHRHTGEFCSKQCASAYRYQMRKEEEKR